MALTSVRAGSGRRSRRTSQGSGSPTGPRKAQGKLAVWPRIARAACFAKAISLGVPSGWAGGLRSAGAIASNSARVRPKSRSASALTVSTRPPVRSSSRIASGAAWTRAS